MVKKKKKKKELFKKQMKNDDKEKQKTKIQNKVLKNFKPFFFSSQLMILKDYKN